MVFFVLVFLLLMIAYYVVIGKYETGWEHTPYIISDEARIPVTSVSVIIPMRNEATNVERLIRSLSEQSYPSALYEVIFIDDFSTDTTIQELENHRFLLQNCSVLSSGNYLTEETNIAFKKKAIEAGIEAANGTLIITTDADCTFQPNWITTVVSFYETNKARCIAGPVRIRPGAGFLHLFQSLDFLTLQGITAGAIRQKLHAMANGANFIYEKALFEEVGGFKNIDQIPSGDDVLLMQKFLAMDPDCVRFLKSPEAIVNTDAASGWKGFFRQRIRWASKSKHYESKPIRMIMLLVFAINLSFLILAITTITKPSRAYLLILFFIGKIIIEFSFVYSVSRFFAMEKKMIWFPVLQPLHMIYTFVTGLLGISGSYTWKGRKINTK